MSGVRTQQPHHEAARDGQTQQVDGLAHGTDTALEGAPVAAGAVQRAVALPPAAMQPQDLLALQRTIGNRAVQRLLAGRLARPVSTIAAPPLIQRRAAAGGAAEQQLWDAIKQSDVHAVNLALAQGANVHAVNEQGRNAYQYAVMVDLNTRAGTAKKAMTTNILVIISQRKQATVPAATHANPLQPTDAIQLPYTQADVAQIGDQFQVTRQTLLSILVRILEYNTTIAHGGEDIDNLYERLEQIDSDINSVNLGDVSDTIYASLEQTQRTLTAHRSKLNTRMRTYLHYTAPIVPGGRHDRHKNYEGMDPKALLQGNLLAIYQNQAKEAKGQDANKTKQEAWSAVAATRAHPDQFSKIVPAPPPAQASADNVEYYANDGTPWDQKTAVRTSGISVEASMENVAESIAHQQTQAKRYPHQRTGQLEQVGVILDCTYLSPREYEILWSKIYQKVAAGTINLSKLREVSVQEIVSSTPAIHIDPERVIEASSGPTKNVEKLELWSTNKGTDANGLRQIDYSTLAKHGGADVTGIIAGTRKSWTYHKNYGGELPAGRRYQEFSAPFLPDPSTARIVYNKRTVGGQTVRSMYLTGTHYEKWTKKTEKGAPETRNAFYAVINVP